MLEPGQYSTVEPSPYEIPLRSCVPEMISFRPRSQAISALYEEPYKYAAILTHTSSSYNVAVSLDTNQSFLDACPLVENSSREVHNYMSPNEYTSLHPPNFDKEQHIYTPPLQQPSSPQQQEHTYFTLEYGEGGGLTSLSQEERREREGEVLAPFSGTSHESQPQEHIYFTLENGVQSVT